MRRTGTYLLLALRAFLIAALVTGLGRPVAVWAASDPAPDRATSSTSPVAAASHPPAGMRILVRFRADATDAQIADAVHSVGGWIDAELPAIGVTRIALAGDANDAFGDGPAVAAVLATHPAVASAEFDRSVRLAFDPNDQYYLTDPYVGLGQWGIRKTQVNLAWDKVRGSPTVTVAILDTGADTGHPDLQGALVPGTTFVSQPSAGCDPNATTDDNSHGTHVAGIVGASGNNGAGIAGVAFGVKVMPLKVLDCTGLGSLSDVASGMIYAADHGARIVNLSLGSPFDSSALHSAVTYATSRNVLVVSAAGNCGTSGNNCTSLDQIEYPAAYPEVLSVGATDTDDTVAFFSSENSTVDVSAPGRRIVSTTPRYATYLSSRGATQNYAAFSGTSQASPLVAGLAALVLSGEPQLTGVQLFQRLESTADDLGPAGRDDGYGYGRVNALRAVSAAAPVAEQYGATYDTSALPRSVAVGKSFVARVGLTNRSSFTWRALDPGSVQLQWSLTDSAGRPVPSFGASVALPADVAAGGTVTVAFPVQMPAAAATYTLRLDLVRSATTTFSSKGVPPAAVPLVAGNGIGATYAPTAVTSTAGTTNFDLGTTSSLSVALTNTGTFTWAAGGTNPVHLSYHWVQNGAVVTWDGLRASLPGDVAGGAKVIVSLPVQSPVRPGAYTLRLDLVQEGVAWFSGLGVQPQDVPANVRSAFVATYATSAPPVLLPGGRAIVPLSVTNIGTSAWPSTGATPVRVAAHVVDLSGNVVSWDGARTSFAADVAPGAQVQTSLIVDAPATPGAYKVRVDLVREGVTWFSSLGVATADVDLAVARDYRALILPGGAITVSRSAPVAQVTFTDTGVAAWTAGGIAPVNAAVHWYDASGKVLVWDGARTPLPKTVAPNEQVALAVQLGAPPAGAAFLVVDLVSEGIAWFGQGTLRPVTFAP